MQYLILYRKSEESKGLEEPHVLGAPSLMVLGEGKQNKWEGGRICRSAVQCRSNPPLPRVMRPIIIMTRIDHLPHFLSPILAQDHACTISQPHPIYSCIPWQWLLSTPRIPFFVLPSFRPSKSTAFEYSWANASLLLLCNCVEQLRLILFHRQPSNSLTELQIHFATTLCCSLTCFHYLEWSGVQCRLDWDSSCVGFAGNPSHLSD